MSKSFYITTPLYYVNDVPHVGHTYTNVIGDTIARYRRMSGKEVLFLSGTDEHGLKIERAASQQGVSPQELTDRNAKAFESTWKRLGIGCDEFIRTTQPRHHKAVQEIFLRIQKNGFVYKGEYSGQYCVRDEAYVTTKDNICPDCGGPTEFIKEESYFFKLSEFGGKLLKFYRDNPDFVIPKSRMNEIVSFVRTGLRDVSISRTSFKWGIPVPNDEAHIFYVWFDALHGYLSGIGFGQPDSEFESTWPAGLQLMGKDILRFHGVYWPAFLMAAGFDPPRQLLVHGWWTRDGEKMSKSLGNFITATQLLENLDQDYIRYFLLREISLGSDGNFSVQALVNRVNSDLANDLGNLASRVTKMIANYFDGQIPASAGMERRDEELIRFSQETIKLYRACFDKYQINKALDTVWDLIGLGNKYIVANEPWALAKDESQRPRLGSVLYNSAELLRVVSVLLNPVLPNGTASILRQLGVPDEPDGHRIDTLVWGALKPDTPLGELAPIYPRLDKKRIRTAFASPGVTPAPAKSPKAKEKKKAKQEDPPSDSRKDKRIGIDDFARVEMRVAKILEAERIPNSSKLIRVQVDLGSEQRQIVAGIGKAYEPEDLVGRVIAVVTNLKPAKLMGVESNGMIVAAEEDGKPVLTTFAEPVALGSRLR